jgi:hypothetical protein
LHELNIGGANSPDDGDEVIGDTRSYGRPFDLRRQRLAWLFSIWPIVDKHGDSLRR